MVVVGDGAAVVAGELGGGCVAPGALRWVVVVVPARGAVPLTPPRPTVVVVVVAEDDVVVVVVGTGRVGVFWSSFPSQKEKTVTIARTPIAAEAAIVPNLNRSV